MTTKTLRALEKAAMLYWNAWKLVTVGRATYRDVERALNAMNEACSRHAAAKREGKR